MKSNFSQKQYGTPEALVAYKPTLEIDQVRHRFKYRPDFSQLQIGNHTGCAIFSRPCNPTGNVLTIDSRRKSSIKITDYG